MQKRLNKGERETFEFLSSYGELWVWPKDYALIEAKFDFDNKTVYLWDKIEDMQIHRYAYDTDEDERYYADAFISTGTDISKKSSEKNPAYKFIRDTFPSLKMKDDKAFPKRKVILYAPSIESIEANRKEYKKYKGRKKIFWGVHIFQNGLEYKPSYFGHSVGFYDYEPYLYFYITHEENHLKELNSQEVNGFKVLYQKPPYEEENSFGLIAKKKIEKKLGGDCTYCSFNFDEKTMEIVVNPYLKRHFHMLGLPDEKIFYFNPKKSNLTTAKYLAKLFPNVNKVCAVYSPYELINEYNAETMEKYNIGKLGETKDGEPIYESNCFFFFVIRGDAEEVCYNLPMEIDGLKIEV